MNYMYLSQTSITLVLLVFLTSTVFYQTINMKTDDVENTIEIKKIALYSENIETTVNKNLEKIVNDVFVNISYEIMNEDMSFYNSADEAENSIENDISNRLNNSLSKLNDKNITISVESVEITPTTNPLIINVNCKVNLNYHKPVNGITILLNKDIELDKDIPLSKLPDPYVYRNDFYEEWNNELNVDVGVNGFTDDKYHTFCIILNNSNFNYNCMNNSNSPREIRVIGYNTTSSKWNVILPYWVQTWRQGINDTSIIWVNCSSNEISGNNIKLLYNSTTTIDKQNPKDTFILYDTFDSNRIDSNIWDVSGGYYIDNNKLIVQGLGSSVWTDKTYGTGYELIFRGSFTPVHAQSVGFFKSKSDDEGVGWDCYNWSSYWLYMRNGSGGSYVPNGNNYLSEFHIYSLKRISEQNLNFTILGDTLDIEYTNISNNGDKGNKYPISINTFTNSNATISIDWIFLKDINSITPTVGAETSNPDYKELKPKTMTGTIYYGDSEQYNYISGLEAGNYSIIGILTNTSDSWGTVGYRPKIEIE